MIEDSNCARTKAQKELMEPPDISCRQLPAMGLKIKPQPRIICTDRAHGFPGGWTDNGHNVCFQNPWKWVNRKSG